MKDRRETLKIVGAIGSTCAFPFAANELYGQQAPPAGHQHSTAALPPAAAPQSPMFFNADEFALVTRLADLIIPATDTPGAVAAGVPLYIDKVVSRNPQAQRLFRVGLVWLEKHCLAHRRKRFLELDEAGQIAVLEPLCAAADDETEAPAGSGRAASRRTRPPGVALFKAAKSLTADGFYTSKEGLIDELGYRGNTVMAEFPACSHEH